MLQTDVEDEQFTPSDTLTSANAHSTQTRRAKKAVQYSETRIYSSPILNSPTTTLQGMVVQSTSDAMTKEAIMKMRNG